MHSLASELATAVCFDFLDRCRESVVEQQFAYLQPVPYYLLELQ